MNRWLISAWPLLTASTALAEEHCAGHHSFLGGIVLTVVYAALGIGIACAAFRAIDFMTPGDLPKQLAEDKNVALGIVVGAFILGVSIIIAAAMLG